MTRPWDLSRERDWFEKLGDGIVAVVPPGQTPGSPLPHGGAWIHLGEEWATAFSGKVEVGQGTRETLRRLVAEELALPIEKVRMKMGDTDVTPWDIGTFGSRAMPDAGRNLRQAAAALRERAKSVSAWRGLREVIAVGADAPLSSPEKWHVAGSEARTRDDTDAVTGERRFTSDLKLPGMLHARLLLPPTLGARLREIDPRGAEKIEGVTVVREGDLVATVAADLVLAGTALRALVASWDSPPVPSMENVADHLRAHPIEGEGFWAAVHDKRGDVDAALAKAADTLTTTYSCAYIAHAPLEQRAAIAEWQGERVTIWTGTQVPFGIRRDVAEALSIGQEKVSVIVPPTGGGYGGKHVAAIAIAAARIAHRVGRPVRVGYSREDEMTRAYFRPMALIDVRAGVAADGTLVAWDFRDVNAGSAGLMTPYRVADARHDYQPSASPLPQGAYRALAATANNFARESHMDELACRAKIDPLAYRLRHLDDPRLAAVLRAAAERAGWSSRPKGSGIAAGMEKGGRVATVVEVSEDGRVRRIVTAFECGAIVDPDNLRNQIEGALVMGIGGALFEAARWDASGRFLTHNFATYRVPRFSDVPPIEVVLIDRKDLPPAGAGETPLIALAPAIGNAIRDLTGTRLRSLPLTSLHGAPASGVSPPIEH
jgi:isoquinoline 1-oxidoreductase